MAMMALNCLQVASVSRQEDFLLGIRASQDSIGRLNKPPRLHISRSTFSRNVSDCFCPSLQSGKLSLFTTSISGTNSSRGSFGLQHARQDSSTPLTSSLRCHSTSDQPYGIPDVETPDRWDVVGLGQAMVDFAAMVGDDFVEKLDLCKGERSVVSHTERSAVLQALDGRSYKVSAGGSLSNTLVALARLGSGGQSPAIEHGGGSGSTKAWPEPLSVAMTGSVGSDALGDFYRTKLLRANVHFLSDPVVDGTTGTVVVLTTPDAQRTMLAYQGMSSVVHFDSALEHAVSRSRLLVVEGYLWDIPQTVDAIAKACQLARSKGVLVALTASDVFCVKAHRNKFWDVMCESADILFANADEAAALVGAPPSSPISSSPAMAAAYLSRFCPLVSVTDGASGSYLGMRGESVFVPPAHCSRAVDTCGAGDAYAAGLLLALMRGAPDLRSMGEVAAKVAAVVVGQQGARLREQDAEVLVQDLYEAWGHTAPAAAPVAFTAPALPSCPVSDPAMAHAKSVHEHRASTGESGHAGSDLLSQGAVFRRMMGLAPIAVPAAAAAAGGGVGNMHFSNESLHPHTHHHHQRQ